jgi:hypothetical protein
MRTHANKTSVRVYDSADTRVPVLRAMHARRLGTYKSVGFEQQPQRQLSLATAS